MCQCNLWWFSVFLTCFCVIFVSTFNVDSFNYAAYEGPHSSMFGFSIALHKEGSRGWLIVGAPEAQSSVQKSVYRGGVVYKCPAHMNGHCEEIPFDHIGNVEKNGREIDNKTEQWFGATVTSSGRTDGPIVACAPRYNLNVKKRDGRDREPVGTCFISDGMFRNFDEYSPCRTYQWGFHRQGSCQAGLSAAINSVGDRLFVGSPGSWYWQGQMNSIDAHAKFEYIPMLFSETYGSKGQVRQQPSEKRPAVFATKEGTKNDDNSYMGYSTIVADFTDDGVQGIAVGIPRANYLRGKVMLFSWNLTDLIYHFTSDQLGSYFGYALAASDVDGDGKVDLIIGAPMYTSQNNEDKYDVGRVCVIYHNSKKGKFSAQYIIDGFNSKSRFGQALASLGDINQDGYGDFAVGAPYDGPDYRGAVYIYHGSKKGVRNKFSQAIFAEDITFGLFGNLRTFGFSLTGGMDLDNNKYPDIAVGAYLSNKAYFFRSRPVIKPEASVKFLTENKEINVEKSNHYLRDGTPVTTTKIQVCVNYSGEEIPDRLDLHRQISLDGNKTISRMGFVQNEGLSVLNETLTVIKNGNLVCSVKDVYVRSDISDKLTALVVEVKYWIEDDNFRHYEVTRDPRSVLKPVLDLDSAQVKKDSISIHKNCRNQSFCIPNLSMAVIPNVEKYSLDSRKPLVLNIVVNNTGDDSFETTLDVKHSHNLFFHNLVSERVVSRLLCNSDPDNHTVHCEIGNPIPKDNIVKFQLQWQPNYKKKGRSYDFYITVNSINNDLSPIKDQCVKNISVELRTDYRLAIRGESSPSRVLFNSFLYNVDISNQSVYTPPNKRLSEETIGPQVVHIFFLKNEGVAEIEESELFFAWPAYTLSGEDFVYLLEPPEFSEKKDIICESVQANYRDFSVISSRKRMSAKYGINNKIYEEESGEKINTPPPPRGGGGEETIMKNKTSKNIGILQVFNGEEQHSGRYRHFQFRGNKYFYRCILRVNGEEEEVNCGREFVFPTEDIILFLQEYDFQQIGNIQYQCMENINGYWKSVNCNYPPTYKYIGGSSVALGSSGEDTGGGILSEEIFYGGINIRKCYLQHVNGNKEEVDCNDKKYQSILTFDQNGTLNGGRGSSGGINIRKCYLQDVNGKRKEVNCNDEKYLSVIGGSTFDQTGASVGGGSYEEDIIRKCYLQGVNGNQEEVDCNDKKYLSVIGGSTFDQTGALVGGGSYGETIIKKCYLQDVNGKKEEVDCNDKKYLGVIGGSTFDQTGASVGGGSYEEGIIRKCYLQGVNGNQEEVDCNDKKYLSVIGGSTFDQTGASVGGGSYEEGIIRKCYLQGVNGNQEEVDCNDKKYLSVIGGSTFDQTGASVGGGSYGEGIIRKCYLQGVNGNQEEVDCNDKKYLSVIGGSTFDQTGASVGGGSYGEGIIRKCYLQGVNGNQEEVDCNDKKYLSVIGGSTFDQTGASVGGGSYEEGIIRKCYLQGVNGNQEEVDCNDKKYLSVIGGSTFDQTGASVGGGSYEEGIIRKCYLQGVNGNQEEVDCNDKKYLSIIGGSTFDQNGTLLAGGSLYREINIRKCYLQDVNGKNEEVDCNDKKYQNILGTSTFDRKCFHIIRGERQSVPCDTILNSGYFYNGNNHGSNDQRNSSAYYRGGSHQYDQNSQTGSHQQNSNYNRKQNTYQWSGYTNTDDNRNGSHYNQPEGSTIYQENNNVHDNDNYNYEEEDEKSISDYINPYEVESRERQQVIYGNGGQRNEEEIQESGLGAAALGNNRYRTVAVDLSDVDSLYGQHYSNGGNRQWQEKNTWSETKEISPSYNNIQEIGRDNVPTDRPMSNRQFHGRNKRQNFQNIADINLPCRTVRCFYMKCTIENLKPNVEIAIAFRGRINAQVLKNVSLKEPLTFSSMMAARIHKLQHIGTSLDQEYTFHELNTTVSVLEPELKPNIVPLWVVILSAVAGVLILLLLVFLLYKLGFFQRNQPSSAPERQPLNRNGYQ